MKNKIVFSALFVGVALLPLSAQIGRRFPSEKKIVIDPVTGVPLTFLTSTPVGDSKIYQTHHQWTSDGKWVIFRSNRVRGQAMAVNEETGDIVQVTDQGYAGMLCLADHSMSLYFARTPGRILGDVTGAPSTGGPMVAANGATEPPANPAPGESGQRPPRPQGPSQIIRVDLEKLFTDSAVGKVGAATEYEHICGTIPEEYGNVGDVALDPTEDFIYFRVSNHEIAGQHLPANAAPEKNFGPRNMGAGPTGLASMNLKTGEIKFIVAVPFQIGHVQTNPWVPGEIVFCWETGGKAKQRTWIVHSDGTGLRPLYPEADYEWITHEAVITKDEVAIAIIALRRPGFFEAAAPSAAVAANDITPADTALPSAMPAQVPPQGQGRRQGRGGGNSDPRAWGPAGSGDHPTGLGIVNLRTREMRIVSQVPIGDPGRSVWHVNGSADGRWAVADDFQYRLWLTDRHTGESIVLADLGRKTTAADHIHPTFNADGTKVEIQTAMLSEDGRSLNICVVPVPKSWLARTYPTKIE